MKMSTPSTPLPTTSRAVVLYQGTPSTPFDQQAARLPSLKSRLVAGAASVVTIGVMGAIVWDMCVGLPFMTVGHWWFLSEFQHALIDSSKAAEEDFPGLFRVLSITSILGMLGLSIGHVGHLWVHDIYKAVLSEGPSAILFKLLGEFGAHCGLALVKLRKLVAALFDKVDHTSAPAH